MSELPPAAFARYLREAMANIADSTGQGMRGGFSDAQGPGGMAGRGAAGGMLAGSIMGGGMAGYDAEAEGDPLARAGMGAGAGALGGAAAGYGVGVGLGGARGGARALRRALAQALREGRSAEQAPRPMPRRMQMIEQLQRLSEMRSQLPEGDPRAAEIDMAISAIRAQLSQLPV